MKIESNGEHMVVRQLHCGTECVGACVWGVRVCGGGVLDH